MTLYLTSLGKNLLLDALADPTQADVYFNGVVIGNGDQGALGDAVTSLGNPLNTLTISDIDSDGQFVNITASLNNADVAAGYRVTEIGVFARDPADHSSSLLFAYARTDVEDAMYLPPAAEYSLTTTLILKVYVDDVEDVSAAIAQSIVYATKASFDAHVANHNNPHAVTAAQVGLGLVQNVTTNNQRPSYSVSSSLSALVSGETLSVAFGKIAAAVQKLINHLSDRANPHQVTYQQTNAAARVHTHNANDIHSGVLSTAVGGTGTTSISQLATIIKRQISTTVPLTVNLAQGGSSIASASAIVTTFGSVQRIKASFVMDGLQLSGSDLTIAGLSGYLTSAPKAGQVFIDQDGTWSAKVWSLNNGNIVIQNAGAMSFTTGRIELDLTF